jgi:putative transposase
MQPNVLRIDSKHYKAKTDKDNDYCDVTYSPRGWACACRDAPRLHNRCDHTRMVLFSIGLREMMPQNQSNDDISKECIYCHSTNVRKHSIRHNKSGDVQRYLCKDCNKKYSHATKIDKYNTIIKAMTLYFDGVTYPQIADALTSIGIKVSAGTIGDWVTKYNTIIKSYVDILTYDTQLYLVPGTNRYQIHPIYQRVRQDPSFVFSILDERTKGQIAEKMWDANETRKWYQIPMASQWQTNPKSVTSN